MWLFLIRYIINITRFGFDYYMIRFGMCVAKNNIWIKLNLFGITFINLYTITSINYYTTHF